MGIYSKQASRITTRAKIILRKGRTPIESGSLEGGKIFKHRKDLEGCGTVDLLSRVRAGIMALSDVGFRVEVVDLFWTLRYTCFDLEQE